MNSLLSLSSGGAKGAAFRAANTRHDTVPNLGPIACVGRKFQNNQLKTAHAMEQLHKAWQRHIRSFYKLLFNFSLANSLSEICESKWPSETEVGISNKISSDVDLFRELSSKTMSSKESEVFRPLDWDIPMGLPLILLT